MSGPMDYASSGVDIDLEGAAVASLIGSLQRSTRQEGTPGAPVDLPGGFGGLIEFGDHLLAMATDGVGSKLQIATAVKNWDSVGIDCMAMNVNDLLCVGAEPIAFVDYIAVPKPDPEVHAAVGASLAKACELANVTLAGGETASLPGIVTELDLSGTALGFLDKDSAITGERLEPGDVLIGLPSSGIHSNGFSLVRNIVNRMGLSYTDSCPFDAGFAGRELSQNPTIADVLLIPTKIYCASVIGLLKHLKTSQNSVHAVHGIAHITGGGLSNLLRLHDTLGWHIDSPLPIPPEFSWLQNEGNVTDLEMHRTFNMGLGMVLAVEKDQADSVLSFVQQYEPTAAIIGHVNDNGHKVTHSN
ncbi:MAG: phosphoribosylformylglycinamidine cyclo-ligase, partial [Candidatus Poseidoniaceae archaeon]|nr:phosphoribosylformylglycinamidine cyclo-ligase [Candidatus Poseidoniaceae archaeon]